MESNRPRPAINPLSMHFVPVDRDMHAACWPRQLARYDRDIYATLAEFWRLGVGIGSLSPVTLGLVEASPRIENACSD